MDQFTSDLEQVKHQLQRLQTPSWAPPVSHTVTHTTTSPYIPSRRLSTNSRVAQRSTAMMDAHIHELEGLLRERTSELAVVSDAKQRAVDELSHVRREWEATMASLRTEFDRHIADKDALQLQVFDLQTQLKQATTRLHDEQAHTDAAHSQLLQASVSAATTVANRRAMDAEGACDKLSLLNSALRDKVDELDGVATELRSQLLASVKKRHRLQAKVTALAEELAECRHRIRAVPRRTDPLPAPTAAVARASSAPDNSARHVAAWTPYQPSTTPIPPATYGSTRLRLHHAAPTTAAGASSSSPVPVTRRPHVRSTPPQSSTLHQPRAATTTASPSPTKRTHVDVGPAVTPVPERFASRVLAVSAVSAITPSGGLEHLASPPPSFALTPNSKPAGVSREHPDLSSPVSAAHEPLGSPAPPLAAPSRSLSLSALRSPETVDVK